MLNRGSSWWEQAGFPKNPLGDVQPQEVLKYQWYVETPAAAAACAYLEQTLKEGTAAKIFIKGPSGGGKTLLMTKLIEILRGGGSEVAVEKVHHRDSKNMTGPAIQALVPEVRAEMEKKLERLRVRSATRRVLVIENLHKGAEQFQQLFLSDCQGILEDAVSEGITLVIIGGKEVFLRPDAQSIGWYEEGSYSLENFTFDEAKEFLQRRLSIATAPGNVEEFFEDAAIAVLLQTNAIPREFKKNADQLLERHFQLGQPITRALATSISLKADENQIEQARLALREKVAGTSLYGGIEDMVHKVAGLSIGEATAHQMVGAVLDEAHDQRARSEPTSIETIAKMVASESIWALDAGTIEQFARVFSDDVEFCAAVGPDGTLRGSPKHYGLVRAAYDRIRDARTKLKNEPLRYHLPVILDKKTKAKPSEVLWGRIEGILKSRRDSCDSLAKARVVDFLSEPKALGKRLPERTTTLVEAIYCQLTRESPKARDPRKTMKGILERLEGDSSHLQAAWDAWDPIDAAAWDREVNWNAPWQDDKRPETFAMELWLELAKVLETITQTRNMDPIPIQQWWTEMRELEKKLARAPLDWKLPDLPKSAQSLLVVLDTASYNTACAAFEGDSSRVQSLLDSFRTNILYSLQVDTSETASAALRALAHFSIGSMRRHPQANSWRQLIAQVKTSADVLKVFGMLLKADIGGATGASEGKLGAEPHLQYVRRLFEIVAKSYRLDGPEESQLEASGAALGLMVCIFHLPEADRNDLLRELGAWIEEEPEIRAFHLVHSALFGIAVRSWTAPSKRKANAEIVEAGATWGAVESGAVAPSADGRCLIFGMTPRDGPTDGTLMQGKLVAELADGMRVIQFEAWATRENLVGCLQGYEPKDDDFSHRRAIHALLNWENLLVGRPGTDVTGKFAVYAVDFGHVENKILQPPKNLKDAPTIHDWRKTVHGKYAIAVRVRVHGQHTEYTNYVAIYWASTAERAQVVMNQFADHLRARIVA